MDGGEGEISRGTTMACRMQRHCCFVAMLLVLMFVAIVVMKVRRHNNHRER